MIQTINKFMSQKNDPNKQIDYTLVIQGNGEIHPTCNRHRHKPYEFNQEKLRDINHQLGRLNEQGFKKRKYFEYFGKLLFEALFIDRSFSETIWRSLEQSDATLCLRLVFEKPIKKPTDFIDQVINLPWEFLYYPDGKTFLGTDPRITLSCEYQDWTKETIEGYAVKDLPLRILFVYAQPDEAPVGFIEQVRDELLKFRKTLGDKVTLEELPNPTIDELRKAFLDEPHVFHFLGHGTLGKLVLKDVKDGTPLFYDGESLADLVRGADIKLVVLQACKGAASLSHSSFSGTAAWLVQQGIPAVVAMRYPISQTLAWRFIQEFYATLTDGQFSVDRAVQMGRHLLSSIVEHAKRDFGAPVLWTRLENDQLFCRQDKKINDVFQSVNDWLLDRFNSAADSKAAFGQVINVADKKANLIERKAAIEKLDNWLNNWKKKIFVMEGNEGDGKTWAVAAWLAKCITNDDKFPPVIFITSRHVNSTNPTELLFNAIPNQLKALYNDKKEKWEKDIDEWLEKSQSPMPIILLVLDGINERYDLDFWRSLFANLETEPYKKRIALLLTCRIRFWQQYAHNELGIGNYIVPWTLPHFNDEELNEAFAKNQHQLKRSDITDDALLELIRKPRYFNLVVKHYEKLLETGDMTVDRLIYEDWKDYLNRKGDRGISSDKFQSFISDLADKSLPNKQNFFTEREIIENLPIVKDQATVFEELVSHGILKEKKHRKGKYFVESRRLTHGFGLLLAERAEDAFSSGGKIAMEEEIAKLLLSQSDKESAICGAAVLHVIINNDIFSQEVQVALLKAWVNRQNLSQEAQEREIPAYFPRSPKPYMSLAEYVWAYATRNSTLQSILMDAFLKYRQNDEVQREFKSNFKRWLGFVPLYGSPYKRGENNKKAEENAQKIKQRLSIEKTTDACDFAGYPLTIIRDDGWLQLGRTALAVISHLPYRPYLDAIAIGCVAEAVMDYPDKYELFAWVLRSSQENIWDDIKVEVQKLLSKQTLITDQATYRLLSYAGNVEAYQLRNKLPKDLFPVHPSKEYYEQEPCRWTLRKENYMDCLDKQDINISLIAKNMAKIAVEPDLPIPENFYHQLQKSFRANQVSPQAIWAHFDTTSVDNFLKDIEATLCAFSPNTMANIVKKVIQSISQREGESISPLAFRLEQCALLFESQDNQLIKQAWVRIHNKYEQLNNREKFAEAKLFEHVLADCDIAEEQLDFLLARKADSLMDSINFERHFLPLSEKSWTEVLDKFQNSSDAKFMSRLLWFISIHSQNIPPNVITELTKFLTHKDTSVRFFVMRTLVNCENEKAIQTVIQGNWEWCSSDNSCRAENYYGSLLLSEKAKTLSYEEIQYRIHPAFLGYAVEKRGLKPAEIEQYAKDIQTIWEQILQSNRTQLPDLPFAIFESDLLEKGIGFENVQLTEDYPSTQPIRFINIHSVWGGKSASSQEFQDSFKIPSDEEMQEERERLYKRFQKAFQEEIEAGNTWFGERFRKNALTEVIKAHPALLEVWLKHFFEDTDVVIHLLILAGSFYEALCDVLFIEAPDKAMKLYNIITSFHHLPFLTKDKKTGIVLLKYALFRQSHYTEIENLWESRIKACCSDIELFEIAVIIHQICSMKWLDNFIKQGLGSELILEQARSIVLMGFLDTEDAGEQLTQRLENLPDSWLQTVTKKSLEHWHHNQWAKVWFKRFLVLENNVEAWAKFRLFLKCVDRRFWIWNTRIIKENKPISKKRLLFLEMNTDDIKNNIEKNEKALKEQFLTEKILDYQAWPWMGVQ